MVRRLAACLVCAGLLAAYAPLAEGSQILLGVEQAQFRAPLTENITSDDDFEGRHSWTAFVVDFSASQILSLYVGIGGVTSALDKTVAGGTTPGTDAGLFISAGISLDQELDTGGALLIGLSNSWGWVEWEEAPSTWDFNYMRTMFTFAYAFLDSDRARPYLGVAYNTYAGEVLQDDATVGEFEYNGRFNLLAGIRARTETFYGVMEATLGGEVGVKLGLEFGF